MESSAHVGKIVLVAGAPVPLLPGELTQIFPCLAAAPRGGYFSRSAGRVPGRARRSEFCGSEGFCLRL